MTGESAALGAAAMAAVCAVLTRTQAVAVPAAVLCAIRGAFATVFLFALSVVLTGFGHGGVPSLGQGLALIVAAALLWALASVWLRVAAVGVEPVLGQGMRMLAATAAMAVMALHSGQSLSPLRYGKRTLLGMGFVGVMDTGVSSVLFLLAMQRAGSGAATLLSSTAPLVALPLAVVVLRERVTRRTAVGAALTVAGVCIVM